MKDAMVWRKDVDTMLCCAFRYALGRRTYVVGMIADLLVKYRSKLDVGSAQRIIKEINEAIERGEAGSDVDIAEWKNVIIKLGGEVE